MKKIIGFISNALKTKSAKEAEERRKNLIKGMLWVENALADVEDNKAAGGMVLKAAKMNLINAMQFRKDAFKAIQEHN